MGVLGSSVGYCGPSWVGDSFGFDYDLTTMTFSTLTALTIVAIFFPLIFKLKDKINFFFKRDFFFFETIV